MNVHAPHLTHSQAGDALARLLEQSDAVCNLWQLVVPAAPEQASSYAFAASTHDVDPNTGVVYRDLLGQRFDECFPETVNTELPEAMARCLHDGAPVELPDLHYQDERTPESWWRITLYKAADDLVGLFALNITAQRQAEVERDAAQDELQSSLQRAESRFETIFRDAGVGIALVDLEGRPVQVNPAFEELLGYTGEELRGMVFTEFTHPEDAAMDQALYGELLAGQRDAYQIEKRYIRKDSQVVTVDLTVSAVRDADGAMLHAVGVAQDITERKVAQRTIAQQAEEILELSTPVMEVWEGVVLAPLIGVLDSDRTERFMETLLEAVAQRSARVVLVDITGVPTIDTQTAQHLIEAVTAARLLGARVVLTGVRPAIAQTLVHLGIDLGSLDTRASLSAGLALALGQDAGNGAARRVSAGNEARS